MGTRPQKGGIAPNFRPIYVLTKGLDGSRCHKKVGLGPGHIVLDGDPAPSPPPKKMGHSTPTVFGPCLLWPNSWMDQDVTWYGGRRRPWPHCVRWEPSSPRERGTAATAPPAFQPMSIIVAKRRSPISATAELLLPYGCILRQFTVSLFVMLFTF